MTVSGSWVGSSVGEIETHDDFDEEPCMHFVADLEENGREVWVEDVKKVYG